MVDGVETSARAVLAVGMDARKRASLRLAFRMHTAVRYRLLEEHEHTAPELALVDGDGPTGLAAWQALRAAHPDLPAVLLSLDPVQLPDAVRVAKPLRVETLFPALEAALRKPPPAASPPPGVLPPAPVSAALAAGSGGGAGARPAAARRAAAPPGRPGPAAREAPPAPLRPPVQFVPPKYFDPDAGLLGMLRGLRKNGIAAWIDVDDQPGVMTIFPQTGQVQPSVSREELRRLCEGGRRVSYHALPAGATPAERPAPDSLDALVWDVARWTARGRLPLGVKVGGTLLALVRWPNLTRLSPIPDALRMAAFMARTPASAALMIKMLQVRPEHLYEFVSALHSLGLLRQIDRNAPAAAATPAPAPGAAAAAPSPARRSLLGRLLGRLTGNRTAA